MALTRASDSGCQRLEVPGTRAAVAVGRRRRGGLGPGHESGSEHHDGHHLTHFRVTVESRLKFKLQLAAVVAPRAPDRQTPTAAVSVTVLAWDCQCQ